jgi:hypothetical protein
MAHSDKQNDYELFVNKYDVKNSRLYNYGDVISRSVEIVIPNEDGNTFTTMYGSRDVLRTPATKARLGVAVVVVMLIVMIVIVILCLVFSASRHTGSNIAEPSTTMYHTGSNITGPSTAVYHINSTVLNSTLSYFVNFTTEY